MRDANLRDAAIKNSNFNLAEMQNTILLIADLADVGDNNLSSEQIQSSLLCNTISPEKWMHLRNRDCEKLIKFWSEKYSISEENASRLIKNDRDKKWKKL